MFRGKTVEKVVGDVTGTIDGIGERRQAKRELEDAPLAAQRRLNEIDAVQPGFWGFARAGWRPFLLWGLSIGVLLTVYQNALGINAEAIDLDRIDSLLYFLMGGVAIREGGKHAPKFFERFKRGRR